MSKSIIIFLLVFLGFIFSVNALIEKGYFADRIQRDITPNQTIMWDIGNSTHYWGEGYFNNINLIENITANWFKGKFNWTSIDNWTTFDGSILTFNSSKLATIYYNATQSQVIAGTIDAGTLVNTQHQDGKYDGITFDFSEVSGSPGLDLRINFTNLSSFNQGVMRYRSSNLNGAYPLIQMWNYDTSIWEDYPAVSTSSAFATITQPIFDSTDHVGTGTNLGVAQMRIYKASNGNTNNKYYVDWIAVSKGYGTPSGVEVDPYSYHTSLLTNISNGNIDTTGYVNASSLNITMINSIRINGNITFMNVGGSFCCGPNNAGTWGCREGACI